MSNYRVIITIFLLCPDEFSELLGNAVCDTHIPPPVGNWLSLVGIKVVRAGFLLREVFRMILALRKMPFYNPSEELSLISARLWHWSCLCGRSFLRFAGALQAGDREQASQWAVGRQCWSGRGPNWPCTASTLQNL